MRRNRKYYTAGCFLLLVAPCLLLSHTNPVVQAQEVAEGEEGEEEIFARFDYEFGFFEDIPEPTDEEMNELLCAHNQYYTAKYRNATSNPTIIYEAQNIDWTHRPGTDYPLAMSLSANITALDGGETPSAGAIISGAFDPGENFEEYIEGYMWPLGGIWYMMNSMKYDTGPSGPGDLFRIEEAICEALPTETPSTDAPTTNEVGASNTTASPTTAATGSNQTTPAPSPSGSSESETFSPTSMVQTTETSSPTEDVNVTGALFTWSRLPG